MNFYKIAFLFWAFIPLGVFSQDTLSIQSFSSIDPSLLKTDEYEQKYYYDARQKAKIYEIKGEKVIVFDEIRLTKKIRFNNQLDRNYYYFINKKLERVYPLFITALSQYRNIQMQLKTIQKGEQRAYTKKIQANLAEEYEAKLRDLTTTEGRVFAKLMSRATGKTVYEIIKELRGGWVAFWWNVKGNIAEVDIKTPYNPHEDRTDLFIESLLKTHWERGYFVPYDGAENFSVQK